MDGWVEKIRSWSAAAARTVKRGMAAAWKAMTCPFVWFGGFAYNRAIALFVPGWLALSGVAVWIAISLAGSCPEATLDCPPVQWFRPDNLAEDFRNLLWAASLVFGGAGAGAALINALRRTRLMHAEHALAQRGQDAETFSRAVNQLGSDQTAVRLGAIYALEGLMRSAFADGGDKTFGRQIGETLAAFVRDQSAEEARREAREKADAAKAEAEKADADVSKVPATKANNALASTTTTKPRKEKQPRLAVDREAAIAVLARSWGVENRPDLESEGGVDLSGARLVGLKLPDRSDLRKFDFSKADLRSARLFEANLAATWLQETKLSDANLSFANLQEALAENADMQFVNLDRANLRLAQLSGASLHEAKLMLANLRGAQLSRAGLNRAQLVGACLDGAQLIGATLDYAMLEQASLRRALLGNAHLHDALLEGTDFDLADISAASFVRANQYSPDEYNWARDLTSQQITSARWLTAKPPKLPASFELLHRGDGKPIDDPSPFDNSWMTDVGSGCV